MIPQSETIGAYSRFPNLFRALEVELRLNPRPLSRMALIWRLLKDGNPFIAFTSLEFLELSRCFPDCLG